MTVQTGLDVLVARDFEPLRQKRVALVCNQASVDRNLQHAADLFYHAHSERKIRLQALLGPQHGLWGHTQDNMIEWEGYLDPRTHLPVYSLYGERRKPPEEVLDNIDVMVIDLQDVGAKYYTFIWTMELCMADCVARGIEVLVLDRPNPLGGGQIEGPYLNESFRSFVGLQPLTVRHGLTIGEVARYLQREFHPGCALEVVPLQGWRREMYFESTGLPWAMPSPNIPTVETAVVYPGMCLLEATNLSEGRGTTRPFEIFGAGWLDGWTFAEGLRQYRLPGVYVRPLEFQPTFHKFKEEVCGGCFIHVTDRQSFQPFLTTIALLREARRLYPEQFSWKEPPYEYEYEKVPIDILVGNDWLRREIDGLAPLEELQARWQAEEALFQEPRQAALLY